MAVLAVLRMGTPSLAERSLEVSEFNTPRLDAIIQDLKDSMAAYGGVGIAAPQVGINQRIVLFGFEHNERYPHEKPVPLTILINPVITFLTEEKAEAWEGCLSVPGLRGKVPRYNKIHYSGYTEKGEAIDRLAEGFHARVVQHECDHLDGILFPQRITDMRDFGFEEVIWERLYGRPYKKG